MDGTPQNPPMVVRPHALEFLRRVHKYWYLCLWTKTSCEWVAPKLDQMGLGVASVPWVLLLDGSHMLQCEMTQPMEGNWVSTTHHSVKPLQLLWARFPEQWRPANILLVDDKALSFALSPHNGVCVFPFYRGVADKAGDDELVWLGTYLEEVGREWHAQGRIVSSAAEGGGGGAWPHSGWRARGMGLT